MQRHPQQRSVAEPPQQFGRERATVFAMMMLATIQVIYFYVARVPSYLSLGLYESGHERMPFQGRMLMRYPLLWAGRSTTLCRVAHWLTATRMFLPRTILPEDIVEFGVGLGAVVFAGYVACELYRTRSRHGKLQPYVYPVFLVMVVLTYCLLSLNFYRYVYDLPSLGLFAAGLFFVYRTEQSLPFAVVFVIATINRETSLLLLPLYVQQRCLSGSRVQWRRLPTLPVGGVAAALLLFWGWFHVWATRHFGVPPADIKPGIGVNLMLLVNPYVWPQLAATGTYLLPLLLLVRRRQPAVREDCRWMAVLPLWVLLMVVYGSIIEVRLFGEFLPLVASTALLVAEERLFSDTAVPAMP